MHRVFSLGDGNDGIITPGILIVTIVIIVIPNARQMQLALLAGSLALVENAKSSECIRV